jgi:hypothetical protein
MTAAFALTCAGVIAIYTAIVHGALGERRIIRAIRFPNAALLILSRGMLWVSVAAWTAAGVLYLVIAQVGPSILATAVILTQAVVLGAGIWCNAQATRGRHPGWMLLVVSVALSFYALAGG